MDECMYVCMHGWMDECMRMYVWMDEWKDECIWMEECIDG